MAEPTAEKKEYKDIEVTLPAEILFSEKAKASLKPEQLEKLQALFKQEGAGKKEYKIKVSNEKVKQFFEKHKGTALKIPKVRIVFKGAKAAVEGGDGKVACLSRAIAVRASNEAWDPKNKELDFYLEIAAPTQ